MPQEKRGRIHLGFSTERFDEKKCLMNIQVMECCNLPPMDSNGLANPYVKLSLLEDKKRATKQKSERREKTLDPNFSKTFLFTISHGDIEKHVYIEVWDWNCMSRNNFIGSMSIKVSDLISGTCDGQRVDQWFKLLEETQGREHNVTIISNEEAAEKLIYEYTREIDMHRRIHKKLSIMCLDTIKE